MDWRSVLIHGGRWANLLIWAPYLLWRWYRTQNIVMLVLALLIAVTDLILIFTNYRNKKPLQVVRVLSVFVAAPLMIFFGIRMNDIILIILGILLFVTDGVLFLTA